MLESRKELGLPLVAGVDAPRATAILSWFGPGEVPRTKQVWGGGELAAVEAPARVEAVVDNLDRGMNGTSITVSLSVSFISRLPPATPAPAGPVLHGLGGPAVDRGVGAAFAAPFPPGEVLLFLLLVPLFVYLTLGDMVRARGGVWALS